MFVQEIGVPEPVPESTNVTTLQPHLHFRFPYIPCLPFSFHSRFILWWPFSR